MKSERTQDIEDFLTTIVRDCYAMDLRTLGENANFFSYDPLIAVPFTNLHTLPMIDAVAKHKLLHKDVGALLHNPSAIRSMFFFDLFMAKIAHVGKDAYMRIFNFYDDVLAAVCTEDRFAKDFKNKIHSPSEIATLVRQCSPGNREIARTLGRLANACYSYSHAAYSDMNPQLVYDNFGPYYEADGRLFAMKIFHNLKPVELWPETSSIPVTSIDIGVLLEGVTMKVDSITHAIYEGNQVDGLRAFSISADGQPIRIEELDAIRKQIEEIAINIYGQVQKSDIETKKRRYCYQKCWGYKKLFDKIGLDWEPPRKVLDAMNGHELFDKWDIPKEKEQSMLYAIFDPRKEMPAEAITR